MSQLSLLLPPSAPPPGDLPPPAADILHAARTIAFSARVVRGGWGVSIGEKRKIVLTGSCCCALGALLVVRGAVAEPRERWIGDVAARVLGIRVRDVRSFVEGFDGKTDDGTDWYKYGRRVAEEVIQ